MFWMKALLFLNSRTASLVIAKVVSRATMNLVIFANTSLLAMAERAKGICSFSPPPASLWWGHHHFWKEWETCRKFIAKQ